MTATNEGRSFAGLLQRFADSPSDVLILNLQSDLPADATLRQQLGRPHWCVGDIPHTSSARFQVKNAKRQRCICVS